MVLVTASEAWIRLVFRSVSSLEMAALKPTLWLQELEIIDIRKRGLERISFLMQAGASDGADFRMHCDTIEFRDCGRGSTVNAV